MYTLVERDTVRSIQQNVRLILTTPKGSDVHRPDFGSNLWKFIDQPLNAITLGRIKAEITEAIETWEPRVKVLSVEIERDYINAKLKVSVLLEVKELGEATEVELWL
jgi:phage baseplate assembly protein W